LLTASLAHRLAVGRLDLDDARARLGHQEGGIGALVDLTEIDHHEPVEREVASLHGPAP
jgi:CO/xanthine dehydrogenase FAD-binding subunit